LHPEHPANFAFDRYRLSGFTINDTEICLTC
jgi:hypothetical protein